MRKTCAALTLAVLVLGGCQGDPTTGVPEFAMTAPSLARAVRSTPSASGHVEKDIMPGLPGGAFEQFSFNAHVAGDGSVAGRFVVSDVWSDGSSTDRWQGDVICLSVEADGKTARMGGIITKSTHPLAPAGMYAIWVVQDNGEGSNAVADKATDLVVGNPWENWALRRCGQAVPPGGGGYWGGPLPLYQGNWSDNLRANVQVRP